MSEFGVIFDNDGVLVDTEHISLEAYQRAIEEQGVKLCEDDMEKNCGLTDADIIDYMKTVYGASLDLEKFSQRKGVLYRELAEQGEMRAFAGVRELLQKLRDVGVPYILASSGSREKIEYNLRRAGLADLMKLYVSGEDFHRGKPDPEIFIRAAEKLHLDPSRCVIFEDSINGLKAARASGGVAVAITNTFPAEKLSAYADHVIKSLEGVTPPDLEQFVADHIVTPAG